MAKHGKSPRSGGGGKKSGHRLAGALAASQAREVQLRKQKHANAIRDQQSKAQKANQGGAKAARRKGKEKAVENGGGKAKLMVEGGERILLVGEGNFSFAASLVTHHSVPGHLLTATCYDSSDLLHSKYPDAASHLATLEAAGAEVLCDVDAGSLDSDKRTKKRRWDRVCWLFPHVGKGIKDEERNIKANQVEIMRFLRAVKGVLESGRPGWEKNGREFAVEEDEKESEAEGDDAEADGGDTPQSRGRPGRVSITLRNAPPYTRWDIPALAKRGPQLAPTILHPSHPSLRSLPQPRYTLLRSAPFLPSFYPGYAHRRTIGWKEGLSTDGSEDVRLPAKERGKGGEVEGTGDARTWEFEVVREEEDD